MKRVPDGVWRIALGQHGVFAAHQAREAGIVPQYVQTMERYGSLHRVHRAVYLVDAYPYDEEEMLAGGRPWQYVAASFWPHGTRGVLSHRSALELHDLSSYRSDTTRFDVTIAKDVRVTRTVPDWLRLHRASIDERDLTWWSGVPITTAARTIRDCISDNVEPRFLREAIEQAERRNLVTRAVAELLAGEAGLGALEPRAASGLVAS